MTGQVSDVRGQVSECPRCGFADPCLCALRAEARLAFEQAPVPPLTFGESLTARLRRLRREHPVRRARVSGPA